MSANEQDLSKMKSIEEVSSAIETAIKGLDQNDKQISITFAREKLTFKVLICQRAGTKCVNGKYSIEGMENDALVFANNANKNFKIKRIYVKEEEDEAIWALREENISPTKYSKSRPNMAINKIPESGDSGSESDTDSEDDHRDYYIVLASAKDEVPPECAWEAVDPHGFVIYDI